MTAVSDAYGTVEELRSNLWKQWIELNKEKYDAQVSLYWLNTRGEEWVEAELRKELSKPKVSRLELLEEYVKAHLWLENLIGNEGSTQHSFDDYNSRVERLRNAALHLPKDIFAEVLQEDRVIYKDLT